MTIRSLPRYAAIAALLLAPLAPLPAHAIDYRNPQADCGKARNPEACADRQAAAALCRGKSGLALQACIEDNVPPRDCGKARNPAHCQAEAAARTACKGKVGKARKNCLVKEVKRLKKEQKEQAKTAAKT